MAFIMKERARTNLDTGKPSVAYYPNGVGGAYLNQKTVMLQIGKHRIFMLQSEWNDAKDSIDHLITSNRG